MIRNILEKKNPKSMDNIWATYFADLLLTSNGLNELHYYVLF